MSLTALGMTVQSPRTKPFLVILKTADQYDLWKARIADACWAATGLDLFTVDDDDCDTALMGLAGGDAEERKQYDWLNKMWLLVTGSLHDDLYRKVHHVKRGMIQICLRK